MSQDRRTQRAHTPLLAAEYYLERQRSLSGAAAVALFDGREMLASSSPRSADRAVLRTWVTDVLNGERLEGVSPPEDLYVHPVKLFGRTLHLASLRTRLHKVREAEVSLARIFA